MAFLRSVLHDCGGGEEICAAYFSMEMEVVGAVRLSDFLEGDHLEFDGDIDPFIDSIVSATAGLPFVALCFHGNPMALRAGRRPVWQSSLDRLIVALAEKEAALIGYIVFDDDEETSWSSIGYGSLAQLPGMECLPRMLVEHYVDESELFLDRVRCDAMAATERLTSAPRRNASSDVAR